MRQLLAFILGFGLMVCGQLNFLAASHARQGTWRKRTDMPTPRYQLSTSVVNGIIYAIGGAGGWATIEAYDPANDTWLRRADMPTSRSGLAASVVDGKIYAIGGGMVKNRLYEFVEVVEVYDPVLDIWGRKRDMPTLRASFSANTVDRKIYVIGGGKEEKDLNRVEVYDPALDVWGGKKDMPTPRSSFSASVVNGEIYVIGGIARDPVDGNVVSAVVEVYNPRTNQWRKRADMPTPRFGLSTSVVDGKIYAIGGAQWDMIGGVVRALPIVEIYEPETDTWTQGPDMPSGNLYFSTETVNGRIYTIGGAQAGHKNFGIGPGPPIVYEFDTGLNVDAKGKLPTLWGSIKNSRDFVR